MKDKLQWAFVIVVSMVLGAGLVIGIDSARGDNDGGGTTAVEQRADSDTPANTGGGSSSTVVQKTPSDVADLVDQVRPSVVLINASNARSGSAGIGSGVVLDKNGNILTNNHVINGFDVLDVTLADGTSAAARLIGRDPGNDIAVIKVDVPSDKLTPAKLGDSDKVRIGEMVIAIGNPFGREGSVTEGIVSGLDRRLDGGTARPLRQLIQTDAAINPGNSGGALFNAKGEVIGITTAIENPSGDRVFAGIGYAVPINTATGEMSALMSGQQIQHPRLGISIMDLTPALATQLNLPVQQGLVITSAEAGSAAAKAGLRASRNGAGADVIVSIDGTKINDYDDLANFLDTKKVGDTVQVKVIRDGKETTVPVTLEAWVDNSA
ncbi:MAG: S1C family serine protease [Dehalococcoidia bacterium]